MLFNSINFMYFFPIVLIGYYLIPKKLKYIWLLICSYYFYMSWNPAYVLLILACTVISYAGSILLERATKTESKKACVFISVVLNLGILIFFKYANFLIDNMNGLLCRVGIELVIRQFDILLPVGISFYTFQALSYTIDVYRGAIKAEKNFLRYALYVSFFPQLVAGPIERSTNLLPQLRQIDNGKKIDWSLMYKGAIYMLWGFFLKMVIADRIGILVDTVFAQYYLFGTVELVAGAVGFALQIYCDFASYSTIAVGAANILGIMLMENFDAPYFSGSIKEFWKRWHISLSSWFRDYVYIPLGGSRCSKARKYCNLLVTFLVSGFWHGASWNFVVWGLLHGIYQVAGDLLMPVRDNVKRVLKIRTGCFSYKLWRRIATFVLVDAAWIFFRADNLAIAVDYIRRIFFRADLWGLSNGAVYRLGLDRFEMNILLCSVIVLLLVDAVRYLKQLKLHEILIRQNLVFQWIFVLGLFFAIFIYGEYGPAFDAAAFIYFQF